MTIKCKLKYVYIRETDKHYVAHEVGGGGEGEGGAIIIS